MRKLYWDCCQFPSRGFEPDDAKKSALCLGKTTVGGMGKFSYDMLSALKGLYDITVAAEEVWEGERLLTPKMEIINGCKVRRAKQIRDQNYIRQLINDIFPAYGIEKIPPLYSMPNFLFSFSSDMDVAEGDYDLSFFNEKHSFLRGAWLKEHKPRSRQAYIYHSTEVGRSGGIYHEGYNLAIDASHGGVYAGNWLARDLDQLGMRAALRSHSALITNELLTKKEILAVGEAHGLTNSQLQHLKNKSFAVHPGVNIGALRRVPAKDREKFNILFLGRLSDRVKNVYRLLEAANKLKNSYELSVRLVSIEDYYIVNDFIKSHHLRDTVWQDKKWYTDEEKSCIYSEADLLFYASLYETFGIVPLEAMACKTPVLIGGGGPRSYIVDGVNGLIADPSSTDSIKEKIEWAITHPEELEDLGEAGYEMVRKYYDWGSAAGKRWHILIDSLMDEKFDELRQIEDGILIPDLSEFGRKPLHDLEKEIKLR